MPINRQIQYGKKDNCPPVLNKILDDLVEEVADVTKLNDAALYGQGTTQTQVTAEELKVKPINLLDVFELKNKPSTLKSSDGHINNKNDEVKNEN